MLYIIYITTKNIASCSPGPSGSRNISLHITMSVPVEASANAARRRVSFEEKVGADGTRAASKPMDCIGTAPIRADSGASKLDGIEGFRRRRKSKRKKKLITAREIQ